MKSEKQVKEEYVRLGYLRSMMLLTNRKDDPMVINIDCKMAALMWVIGEPFNIEEYESPNDGADDPNDDADEWRDEK